jgi:transposase
MLSVASTARVYLYMQAVDMRRSYDGLHAIVQSEFTRDFRLSNYFIFIHRCHERIKIFLRLKERLTSFIKRLEAIASRHGPRVSGRKHSLRNGPETSFSSPRNRCTDAQATGILAQSPHPAAPLWCAFPNALTPGNSGICVDCLIGSQKFTKQPFLGVQIAGFPAKSQVASNLRVQKGTLLAQIPMVT